MIKSKKKRGIKDEWQILNSGQLKKVGNDTRIVHSIGFNFIQFGSRTYTHHDVCNTYRLNRGNATHTVASHGRSVSSFPRATLSQRITTDYKHIHVLLRKTEDVQMERMVL